MCSLITDLKDNIRHGPRRRQECGISVASLCEVHAAELVLRQSTKERCGDQETMWTQFSHVIVQLSRKVTAWCQNGGWCISFLIAQKKKKASTHATQKKKGHSFYFDVAPSLRKHSHHTHTWSYTGTHICIGAHARTHTHKTQMLFAHSCHELE